MSGLLQVHPDRGGDTKQFSEISTAHTKLMAIQADLDERERSAEFEYEAIVEKVNIYMHKQCVCDRWRKLYFSQKRGERVLD